MAMFNLAEKKSSKEALISLVMNCFRDGMTPSEINDYLQIKNAREIIVFEWHKEKTGQGRAIYR